MVVQVRGIQTAKVRAVDGRVRADTIRAILTDRSTGDPGFRGRKLGLYVLTAILSTVGRSVSTVVLEAAPVLGDDGPKEGTPEHGQACAALKKHWRSSGFKPAGKKYLTLNTTAVKALNK